MKLIFNLVLTLTILFTCAVAAAAQEDKKQDSKNKKSSSQVSVKYDKKKDLTTVKSKETTITQLTQEKDVAYNIPLHQMDLEVSFSYQGQLQPTKPVEEVVLRFRSTAGNNIFLRPQQIMAVLDKDNQEKGRAMALGSTDYKSGAPKFNSIYEEVMTVKVPADVLTKMAKAETIDLYVGEVKYRLKTQQHDMIRELASLLTAPANVAQMR